MICPVLKSQLGVGCAAVGTTCLRVITAMGTPILWWLAALALLWAIWLWLGRRDWRFGVPVLAVLAVWLPWFQYADRPLFFFYAIMIIPFYATPNIVGVKDGIVNYGASQFESADWTQVGMKA